MTERKRSLAMGRLEDSHRPRPCIHCGYCCKEARCALSLIAEGFYNEANLPDPAQAAYEHPKAMSVDCPYLRERDGGFFCGLLDEDSHMPREKVLEWLAVGAGCNSPLNSERRRKAQADKEARDRAINKIANRNRRPE